MNPEQKKAFPTKTLVESSLLVAIGFVLSYIVVFKMPQGGSVTAVCMLPIILLGLRRGPAWGLAGGAVMGLLQLFQDGGLFPPTATFVDFLLVFLLDYFIAYAVLGLSGLWGKQRNDVFIAVPVCLILRFICHLLSGVIIWHVYAEGQNPWLYSLIYNGSYMGVELVLTMIVVTLLWRVLPADLLVRQKGS